MYTKRIQTIDVLKFIFSILIVGIHSGLFLDISMPLFQCFSGGIFRIGVPFFFIVAR